MPRLRLRHLLGGLTLALATLSAQAVGIAGDVTVQLLAPGGTAGGGPSPIALSQTVLNADLGAGVQATNLGGSGDISNFMLDNERIFFSDTMILLRVAVGDDTGALTTGYLGSGGEHARYQFDGIVFTGRTITNLLVYAYDGFATSGPPSATGLLSPADPAVLVHQVDADSIAFDLDTEVFKDRFKGSGNNYAEFRIDVITAPVPEPSTYLLLAGGLLTLLRRRAAHRD